MTVNIKYYKIKLIKKFLSNTTQARTNILNELVINATDPVIYKRRLRMLEHLSRYEQQIINKLQNFDTEDPRDFDTASKDILRGLGHIVNKSA